MMFDPIEARNRRERLMRPMNGHVSTELDILSRRAYGARRQAQKDRRRELIAKVDKFRKKTVQQRLLTELSKPIVQDIAATYPQFAQDKRLSTEENIDTIDLSLPMRPTLQQVVTAVCGHFRIELRVLLSPLRTKRIVYPRMVAMYLAREYTMLSLPAIGRLMAKRDHTTVLHACNKIARRLEAEEKVRTDVETLRIILGV